MRGAKPVSVRQCDGCQHPLERVVPEWVKDREHPFDPDKTLFNDVTGTPFFRAFRGRGRVLYALKGETLLPIDVLEDGKVVVECTFKLSRDNLALVAIMARSAGAKIDSRQELLKQAQQLLQSGGIMYFLMHEDRDLTRGFAVVDRLFPELPKLSLNPNS